MGETYHVDGFVVLTDDQKRVFNNIAAFQSLIPRLAELEYHLQPIGQNGVKIDPTERFKDDSNDALMRASFESIFFRFLHQYEGKTKSKAEIKTITHKFELDITIRQVSRIEFSAILAYMILCYRYLFPKLVLDFTVFFLDEVDTHVIFNSCHTNNELIYSTLERDLMMILKYEIQENPNPNNVWFPTFRIFKQCSFLTFDSFGPYPRFGQIKKRINIEEDPEFIKKVESSKEQANQETILTVLRKLKTDVDRVKQIFQVNTINDAIILVEQWKVNKRKIALEDEEKGLDYYIEKLREYDVVNEFTNRIDVD